jgi:Fe-S cluster assembly protein SufD
MMQDFEINSSRIDKIKKISEKEKNFRTQNLDFFKSVGFPNKRLEDWKFSDFKDIVNKNFDELSIQDLSYNTPKMNLLKDFDHNYIFLVNGSLHSSNFNFEEKKKIKINIYDKDINQQISKNPLVCLNHALSENGYFLEVERNYKFKKVLIIYNYFTKDIKNKILNNKNRIKINENSELHVIEYTVNESKFNFISNVHEDIELEKNSKLKSLYIQHDKSNGFFHKYIKNKLFYNSDYSNLIFSSGLKFNKLDIECDLIEDKCNCNIMSALFLKKGEHQEIKTRINHLAPNCTSFQKIKKVLNSDSKGIFQGKIYVKNVAQKTNAYQLSKALLINDDAEFNSKPELEIYADDVKCTHGSTSGNIDEDALYYLMARGLNREESVKLLVKGFLNDIIEFIKNPSIKIFVENKLEDQINGR